MHPQTLPLLLDIMEEQLKVMNDLMLISTKKSQVLVDGNLPELDVLIRGEQALVWHMGRLETKRFHLQMQVAGEMDCHPTEVTCARLVELAPPQEAARCERISETYGTSAKELMERNRLNSELIQQAMSYVDYTLQFLGATDSASGQVYSPRGNRDGKEAKLRRLDNRA
jgi:flagellar biosynthesis/type III secretory pathway chaperone